MRTGWKGVHNLSFMWHTVTIPFERPLYACISIGQCSFIIKTLITNKLQEPFHVNTLTYCVRRNFPVWPASVVFRRPLYKPPIPPTAAPAIHETPIWEKASSKRPLCRDAPSGKINSGWLWGKYTGSKFRYGESGARFCCECTKKIIKMQCQYVSCIRKKKNAIPHEP